MIRRSRGRSLSSEDYQEDESEWLPKQKPAVTKKRGRKPQDFQWTRVLKFEFFMDEFPPLYSVPRDLNLQKEEEDEYSQKDFKDGDHIIFHDDFKNKKEALNIEDYRMKEPELRLYAEKLLIVRREIQKQAKEIGEREELGPEEAKEQQIIQNINLNRKFEQKKRGRRVQKGVFTPEFSADRQVRKTRKLCELSFEEKLDIIFTVRVKKFQQKDVASLYRVKATLVQKLVSKASKNLNFMRELMFVQENKIQRRELISMTIRGLYASAQGISKTDDVVKKVDQQHNIRASKYEVQQIMKLDSDLQYKPIKRIAFQANSPRALILRQMYARSMTEQLLKGKIVINCDETWLNLKDYTRRCWRKRGEANSSNIPVISPRISLISAIDNRGECYFSMTQVNTDHEIKSMFLFYLAQLLDQERPEWRTDTIILMDNASYNKAEETIQFIKKHKIPVIFSAAYSYDAAPIERYFGYLKQGVVMQPNQPSGKTQVVSSCLPNGRINIEDEIDEKVCKCQVLAYLLSSSIRILIIQTFVICFTTINMKAEQMLCLSK